MIGPANETKVQIEGEPFLTLIDSRTQLSTLPELLVEKLKLKIHSLNTIIEDYAKVVQPLNTLISGQNTSKKKKLVEWTEECQSAFNKLKELCTITPILAYADYKKEFQLHTDASELGFGGVLYQADDQGILKVIAYASRSLNQMERNYPIHKLEFLALKWTVTDHFHEYFYGGRFDLYIDNNPLTYILTSAKLDACGQRWVASLVNYDFRLFYKMGKTNI